MSRDATPITTHWVEEGIDIVPVKLEHGSNAVEKGFAAALTVGDFSVCNTKPYVLQENKTDMDKNPLVRGKTDCSPEEEK